MIVIQKKVARKKNMLRWPSTAHSGDMNRSVECLWTMMSVRKANIRDTAKFSMILL